MRIRSILLAALVLCLLPIAASAIDFPLSQKLRDDMPTFSFSLAYDQQKPNADAADENYIYVHGITVKNQDTGALVQQIALDPPAETCDDETLGFSIEDMNFDGYLDINEMQYVSAGYNVSFYCWLWDPTTQSFVYNEALSAIPSPMFDPETKQVYGSSTDGDSAYVDTTYEYRGSELVLIKRETIGYDYTSGEQITTTEELKDGQLSVTGSRKESILESDEGTTGN